MADIELLFGVLGGGDISGESGSQIKNDLEDIVRAINKSESLKVKVGVDVDGSKSQWESDLQELVGASVKPIDIKVDKVDADGALTDFKSQLEQIVNSVSISNGVKIDIKGLDVGDVATDLKQVGDAAKNSATDTDRLNAELKELKLQAASITTAYKNITNTTASSVNGVQISEITEKYTELQAAIEAMNRVGASSANPHIAKVRELEASLRKMLEEAKKSKTEFGPGTPANEKALTKVNNLIADIAKNQREWTKAQDGSSAGSYRKLSYYSKQLSDLAGDLITGNIKLEDFKKSFDAISDGVMSARKNIKAAGEATKSWSERWSGLVGKFTSWLSVAEIVTAVYHAMQKMAECVVEVDTAMTELKKVTDATEATYDRFLTNATTRTRELGATLSDVVKATAEFARLGHGIDDASILADAAVVYKNVGDGIEDIEVASKSIISTMQAFGVEVRDAMSIVDIFNAVGNRFAVSSVGIGEALLNSAAALASAGNTIHESVALIAAANTTIQDPSRVGTALKTVSMYMRAAKTEAEEAGISTEGMANSVSELREEILALTGQKVDIMENVDTGEYKSTVEVLGELSKIWDKLTDTSRTNITELIGGGVRNANVISALMQNFSIVEEAMGVSMDSAGSALAENEKYLDSIAGRIEKLKASFEALSTSIIDSGLAKFFVSLADGLLQFATMISDIALDDIFSTLATLAGGGALTAFFTNLDSLENLGKIKEAIDLFGDGAELLSASKEMLDLDGFGDAVKEIIGDMDFDDAADSLRRLGFEGNDLVNVLGKMGFDTDQFSDKLKSVGETGVKSTSKLGTAFAGLAAKIGISTTALGLLTGALAVFAVAAVGVKLYNDYIQKCVDNAREAASAWSKSSDALNTQKQKVDELRTALDSGTLTEQEAYNAKSELYSIQQSLVEGYGREADGIDLVNGELTAQIGLLDKLSSKDATLFLIKNAEGINKAAKEMEKSRELFLGSIYNVETSDNALIDEIFEKYSNFISLVRDEDGVVTKVYFEGDASHADKVIDDLMVDIKAASSNLDISASFDNFLSQLADQSAAINEVLENYQDLHNEAKKAQLVADTNIYTYGDHGKTAAAWIAEYSKAVEKYNNALAFGTDEEISAAATEFARLDAIIKELSVGGMSVYSDMIQDIINQLNTAAIAEKDFIDILNGGFLNNRTITANVNGLRDSGATDIDLLASLNTEGFQEGEYHFRRIVDAAIEAKFIANDSTEEVQRLVALLVQLGIVSGNTIANTASSLSVPVKKLESISSGIDSVQSRISTLSSALSSLRDGSMSLEDVIDLMQQFPELYEYVDLTAEGFGDLEKGLENLIKASPDSLIQTLQGFKETYDLTEAQTSAIDGLCAALSSMPTDAIKNTSSEFGVLAESINAAKKAQSELEKALAEDDYDSGYESRVTAFEGLQEVVKNGEYGSKAYAAYKEYFGLEDLDSTGVKEWMQNNAKYFAEGTNGVAAFLKTVETLSSTDEEFAKIASYDSATKAFYYDINALSEFADKLGWSEEMLQDFIDKYRMYCEEWESRSAQDNLTEFTKAGLVIETESGTYASLQQLMNYTSLTREEVQGLINDINILKNPQIDSSGIEDIDNELRKLGEGGSVDLTIRPKVSAKQLIEDGGWDVAANEVATVFTSTFTDETGTVAVNFTPIVVDENGNYVDTLSESALTEYAEAVIAGTREDDLNLKIGSVFVGENAIEDAEAAADRIHELHEKLLSNDDNGIQLIGADQITLTQQVVDNLLNANGSAEEVKELIKEMSKNGTLTFEAGITLGDQTIEEIIAEDIGDDSEVVSVDVKMNLNGEEVTLKIQTVESELIRVCGKDYKATLAAIDEATDPINSVEKILSGLNGDKATVYVKNNVSNTITNLKTILSLLEQIQKNSDINVGDSGNNTDPPSSDPQRKYATGTKHAIKGPALLGDEFSPNGDPKPELVVSGDSAYIAGENGPEIGYLEDGDVVYTADETDKILNGKSINGSIPAHAGGTAPDIGGNGGGPKNPSAGPPPSSGDKNSGKSEFEKMYAYYQHLLELGKIDLEEYLEWLNQAYEEAYKNGEITLEEYYRYIEEYYQGLKDLFMDYLNDTEHEISKIEYEGGDPQAIIALYREMMAKIEKEIAAAIESGLDENDDYIQELWEKWMGYGDAIKDIENDVTDNAKSAAEKLIDYRIKMLKQELENEKDALNEKLDNLRAFYDEQKQMLQDSYDEEKYLEEQAEKRKTKSDIEAELAALEFDDSAWAQKRKLELQEDLAKADKDLADFEKDHALDATKDFLDKQYKQQEELLNKEIEAIDAKLNDPKALYNQALLDIQKNSTKLYEEMVAYNDKYGTGNPDDIKYMWDEAKGFFDEFLKLFGEAFKGIMLVPSPSGGYASGTQSASPGTKAVDENGSEYVFTSKDGRRYRVFSGGEKVLNAAATDFLYDFAMSGGAALSNILSNLLNAAGITGIQKQSSPVQLSTGDIVIQGNADSHTVSEIRRAQRENIDYVLKQFTKLNK